MELWHFLVMAAVIVVGPVVYRALSDAGCEFRVRIQNGSVRSERGKITRAQLGVIGEVVRDQHVTRGWVAGHRSGRLVRLRFSRGFPAIAAQQLRNLWNS